ncbi:Hypothetical predicted protein [Mytilus galloprovincialis]|uniref:EGF-like domain-containing protein n=1 Tax=Mytilus galloprovincialis TaxID=29158 RepID=A0A8B6GUJ2_MYTGA|nr:Hypothetical predicted protein [Mytilus galloprovincialis]
MNYKTFCERYYFNLLAVLSSTFIVSSAVFRCGNGIKQCQLSQWGQWSNCTSPCGGGISMRYKHMCCNKTYSSFEKCAKDCNITTTDYSEMKICGKTCVNGVFRQNKCQCPNRFTGKCCETEIATIPVATNGLTASSSKTEIITNVCEQGCEFGECKNGTCACMAVFKGKACQKRK